MKYVFIAAVLCLLLSCEKEIKLSVQNQPPKLVVDASIENGGTPLVVLSESVNYFSSISAEELAKTFVHDAVVTVSNGTTIMQLKEYPFADTSGYTLYYYAPDDSNTTDLFLGEFGKTYTLNITTADNKTYAATTTIPLLTKRCDSIWWKPAPFADDSNLCIMYGRFTDPPGLGNYVRYFTRINSGRFLPGLTSSFDDQVVDGITYSLSFDLGWNKNNLDKPTSENNYGYAMRGDTVTLKYCNIDKATYTFWNTWDFAWQSYGNPFSSPVKVQGNISNDALGAFSGYAVQYLSLVIPR